MIYSHGQNKLKLLKRLYHALDLDKLGHVIYHLNKLFKIFLYMYLFCFLYAKNFVVINKEKKIGKTLFTYKVLKGIDTQSLKAS